MCPGVKVYSSSVKHNHVFQAFLALCYGIVRKLSYMVSVYPQTYIQVIQTYNDNEKKNEFSFVILVT